MTIIENAVDKNGRARVRYSSAVVAEARRLSDAGWDPADIGRIIGRTHGTKPSLETVRGWVDEEYAERRRTQFARQKRQRRRASGVTWLPQSANLDTKLHRMTVLHEAGLSCNAIATVMNLDYGLGLTENSVRGFFAVGSVPLDMRRRAA